MLGRHGALSDVVVAQDSVSRQHAAVVHRGARSFVFDLGSTKGTFVDGEAAPAHSPVEIKKGTMLRVGTARFTFFVPDAPKKPKKRTREPSQEESRPSKTAAPEELPTTAVPYDPGAAIFGAMAKARAQAASGGGFSWADALK